MIKFHFMPFQFDFYHFQTLAQATHAKCNVGTKWADTLTNQIRTRTPLGQTYDLAKSNSEKLTVRNRKMSILIVTDCI